MISAKRPYLTFRLQWLVFGSAVMLLAFVLGESLYRRHEDTKNREQDRLLAATQVLQASIERNLRSINRSLANLSEKLHITTSDQGLDAHLKTIGDAMSMVESLSVINASGHIQASSDAQLRGLAHSFSDRAYFQSPRDHPNADTMYVSPPFKTVLGTYTIALTRMIANSQGQFNGVVMAFIDPGYFDPLLASVLYSPDMVADLHHDDGIVFMMAPDSHSSVNGANLAKPGSFFTQHKESGRSVNVFSGAFRATGDDRMIALRDVRPPELRMDHAIGVTVSRQLHDIFAKWRHDAMVMLGSALAATLAAAFGLSFYQRRHRQFMARETIANKHQQVAASVFTHAHEGITITDPTGTIIDINARFTQITGYSLEDVLGKNPRILQSGRQDKAFYTAMWHDLTTQGHWSGEIWNQRKNGEVYPEILNISAVLDSQGNTLHYVALFSDITAIKRHQSELERIAHFDTLTGLPNRLLLSDRMTQAMVQCQRHGKSIAVVFIDLDNLKTINDSHSHEAGDTVLVTVSQRMKEALRDGDTLARVGGDEFVAVLTDLDDSQDSNPVIQRLMGIADEEVVISVPDGNGGEKQALKVSTSIGVTFYPQDDVDAEVLIRHADHAMFLAKQAGKNRYHLFDTVQDMAIRTKHKGLQQVKDGLNRQEFVLFYQPKLNMRTGKVFGAEALIRWQSPERGLLPPAAFLHIVEDHPISIDMGEWVIETALAQMSAWHAQGLDLKVSVNIGALQLQQEDFPQRLHDILAAHPDVLPQCLQLEILETSALQDIAKVTAVMHACQALGVAFALDDFGTGYSSLTYLKRFPAQVLKIDQSFIRGLAEDPDDLAIVKGVIELASIFHREVIAEGVETKALGKLLMAIGCEQAQGYGIARPMPAADLPGWVATWQAKPVWTA